MTSEEIRSEIVRRLRAKADGRWWVLGCDSGYHANTGRCDCEGGRWVLTEDVPNSDGQPMFAYYTPGYDTPLYVEPSA